MKPIRDRFSGHSDLYKKYRPEYPEALYRAILEFCPGRQNSWDCATGNGQVARELARHFKRVYATDISPNQLKHAPFLDNVTYGVQRAESTSFDAHLFDLITVAQAIHWFDIPAFFEEVKRVSRPGGVLAAWGYGLVSLGPQIDPVIAHFYREIAGPYWDGERRIIDEQYRSIQFPLEAGIDLGAFSIERRFDLPGLHGYLSSWSSVQKYIGKHGANPVDELVSELKPLWPKDTMLRAVFPLFGRLGHIVQ